MAGKKQKGEQKVTYAYGSKLFEKLGVTQLRSFLEKHFPESTIRQAGTATLVMNCLTPGHPDVHPSMFLDSAKGFVKCRSCGYYTKNIFQLFQDCKHWSIKESISQIQAHTGLRLVTDKVEKELDDLDVHQLATKILMDICNDHLVACISHQAMPAAQGDYTAPMIRSVQATLDWLFRTRGHNREYASQLPYGIMPPAHMVFARVEKVLGDMTTKAYADKGRETTGWKERREKVTARVKTILEKVDGSWTGAVTFHTGYSFTTPGRIRLRRPSTDNIKDGNFMVLPGHNDDDSLGFFGLYSKLLSAFNTTSQESDEQIYLVVEGENDAISLMERIVDAGKSGIVVIATGGSANKTDELSEAGIKRIYLWGDEPLFGKGEEWVKTRLKTACDVECRVFTRWHEFVTNTPKDPDDVCRTYPFHDIYRIVISEREASFKPTEIWAYERTLEEVANEDIPDTEVLKRQNVAVEYGQCVRHPAQLESFIGRISETLKLSPGALRNEVVKIKDTEAGYISRIAETIKHEFHTLYKVDGARGGELHLFHKKTRREIHFYMTDGKAMVAQLSNVFGEMYEFFKDHIGMPGGNDENLEDVRHSSLIKEGHKNIRDYLEIAMQIVYKGVPAKSECIPVGQGLHLLPDLEFEGQKCLYFNNGQRVFRGRRTTIGSSVEWVELPGPADGGYLFVTADLPWSLEVKSVEDLNEGNSVSAEQLRRVRDDLYNIFFNHWSFASQRVDALFLSHHLLASAVQCAFSTKIILAFIGGTHSGKSTALSVFCGKPYKRIQVLEACAATSNYTAASVYQKWDRSTLGMALDEFEDEGDNTQKSQAVANISEILRNIISDEGAVISRGSADKNAHDYRLHTFVMLASIARARKAQDENRRFDVETQHKGGMKDPAVAIFDTVTPTRLEEIRRLLTIGMPKFAFELAEHHDQINREINSSQIVPFDIPTRFIKNFLPVSAVMAMMGEDWRPFVISACESRKNKLDAVAKDNASNNLGEIILKTPAIRMGATATSSVLSILGKDEDWLMLNHSQSGVYFDNEHKVLIIDWISTMATNGLLNRVEAYSKQTWRNLKHTLDQNPMAMKTDDYQSAGIFTFLRSVNVMAEKHEISVLQLKDLVSKLRTGPKAVGVGTSQPLQHMQTAVRTEAGSGGLVGGSNDGSNNI